MHPLTRGSSRPSALANLFYSGCPDTLERTVQGYLRKVAGNDQPCALLVPHAGYIYSGQTAGLAFSTICEAPPRIVLIGPAHRVALRGISGGDFCHYETPLGPLPVDREQLATLEAQDLIQFQAAAHAEEHALEVLLPFVRVSCGEVPIVPLLIGHSSPESIDRVLEATLRADDLLLISSDLSHFHPYDDARQRDICTLEHVLAGRWQHLGSSMACGYRGLAAALRLAEKREWKKRLIDYRCSGDTAGNKRRVVGYGAVSFTRKTP